MQVNITPTKLQGTPKIPADKSWIIRYMIVSKIKDCDLTIRNINLCDDVLACMDCLDNLGGVMNAGESATVLRLLLPWTVKTYGHADFILEGNLPNRPMGPYEDIFAVWNLDGNMLHVEGPITNKDMDRDISSQFFSGMLLAGYDLGECVSKRYLDMTRQVLCQPTPFDVTIPEDVSLKAFFTSFDSISTFDEPDLVIPKAYFASVLPGLHEIYFDNRLKYKESDRIDSVCDVINTLGGKCSVSENHLIIEGCSSLAGGTVSSHSDHRIAIMAAMLAQYCENSVIIEDAECVSKSWPCFYDEYERLGGIIDVI